VQKKNAAQNKFKLIPGKDDESSHKMYVLGEKSSTPHDL
jgi:hypothetical protein